ncbi:MAG: hypothetical protein RR738_01150 [Anaerorhabdus sp.]|nr:hypothetical protein [Erysipelotrichales bacterium]
MRYIQGIIQRYFPNNFDHVIDVQNSSGMIKVLEKIDLSLEECLMLDFCKEK